MKIQDYDSSEYDTIAMQEDKSFGNFSPENAKDYRFENIVQASLMSGDFSQAQKQCSNFGLDYEQEFFKFRGRGLNKWAVYRKSTKKTS